MGARAQTQAADNPASKKDEDCGCEAKIPDGRAGIVNGVKVSVAEIDVPIKDKIKELQDQVVEARKAELDLLINARLLDVEAKKRGVSAEKILQTEVEAKLIEPADADAQTFYNQNRDQIQGDFKDVKGQILAYLRGERMRIQAKRLADQLRSTAQIKITAQPTPPQSEADRARVLATLNGESITSGDVEDALLPNIFEAQDQIYEMRKQALDAKINDILLDQESKKRNTTAQDLYHTEVGMKAKPVTEDEAKKFYDSNKERLNGSFEDMRVQIIQFLQSKAYEQAETDFATSLRKAATVESYLRAPDPPVLKISIDDQPMRGNPNAPVTIIEFTDYQCPMCGRTAPILEDILKEFGDKVRLVARDFPLDQHKNALKAAEAAEAAREQGKYWEFTAILFKNQEALEEPKLKEYATQLGLDRAKFDQALTSGKFYDKVQHDLREGEKLGVSGTPTIFINGRRLRDRTADGLRAAVNAALKSAPGK
jgi:protein-disulfide isomerase